MGEQDRNCPVRAKFDYFMSDTVRLVESLTNEI